VLVEPKRPPPLALDDCCCVLDPNNPSPDFTANGFETADDVDPNNPPPVDGAAGVVLLVPNRPVEAEVVLAPNRPVEAEFVLAPNKPPPEVVEADLLPKSPPPVDAANGLLTAAPPPVEVANGLLVAAAVLAPNSPPLVAGLLPNNDVDEAAGVPNSPPDDAPVADAPVENKLFEDLDANGFPAAAGVAAVVVTDDCNSCNNCSLLIVLSWLRRVMICDVIADSPLRYV